MKKKTHPIAFCYVGTGHEKKGDTIQIQRLPFGAVLLELSKPLPKDRQIRFFVQIELIP